jgi:hypothetical protein
MVVVVVVVVVVGAFSRRRVVDVTARGIVDVVVLAAGFAELEHPAIATAPSTIAASLLFRPFAFMGVSLSARSPRRRRS